ncbi:MAG: hypothetical protein FJX53_14820 [Alphaproteobacteria bacterium]|nr:hypothetical protein [Alphaproteobacteria bacterium]
MAIALAGVGAPAIAQAEDAASIFARHREVILRPGVTARDGYAFASVSLAIGRGGVDAACAKARLLGIERLVDASLVIEAIEAESLQSQYDRAVRALRQRSVAVVVRGMEQVHTQADDRTAVVVVAVPESAFPTETVQREDGAAIVCAAAREPGAPFALCLLANEIAREALQAQAKSAVIDRFAPAAWPLAADWPAWVASLGGDTLASAPAVADAIARFEAQPDAAGYLAVLAALRAAGYVRSADAIAAAHPAPVPVPAERAAAHAVEAGGIDAAASPSLAAWLSALARFGEQHPTNAEPVVADAVVAAIEAGQWETALARLVDSPSRDATWFRLAAIVLESLQASELAAVCARIAATAAADDFECQMDRVDAELRTRQWDAARTALDRLTERPDLAPLQRARLQRARRSLPPR